MRKQKRQLKQAFLAWLLMAIFLTPMTIAAVHQHHDNNIVSICASNTADTHNSSSHANNCLICHFIFSPLHFATTYVLPVVFILLGSTVIARQLAFITQPIIGIISLRAPPTLA